MSLSSLAHKIFRAAHKGRAGRQETQRDNPGPFTDADKAALLRAACGYDPCTVRDILSRWPEAVNTAGDDGLTPLHCAAMGIGMDQSQVGWLLGLGADTTLRDRYGNTPLHYAAQAALDEATAALIQAGAAVDSPNDKGETPLYYAIMFERPGNVHLLVAAGARETAARADGETPRSLAPKEDKSPPGGTSPAAARPDMASTLDAAQAARSAAFAAAPVLAQDLPLVPAPTVRKRVKKAP